MSWHKFANRLWDFYQNMNYMAPLPAKVNADCIPIMKIIYIGKDLEREIDAVEHVELRADVSGAERPGRLDVKFNGVRTHALDWQSDGRGSVRLNPESVVLGEIKSLSGSIHNRTYQKCLLSRMSRSMCVTGWTQYPRRAD